MGPRGPGSWPRGKGNLPPRLLPAGWYRPDHREMARVASAVDPGARPAQDEGEPAKCCADPPSDSSSATGTSSYRWSRTSCSSSSPINPPTSSSNSSEQPPERTPQPTYSPTARRRVNRDAVLAARAPRLCRQQPRRRPGRRPVRENDRGAVLVERRRVGAGGHLSGVASAQRDRGVAPAGRAALARETSRGDPRAAVSRDPARHRSAGPSSRSSSSPSPRAFRTPKSRSRCTSTCLPSARVTSTS